MTTTISQVDNRSIEYGVLIDLRLDDTTYYISNCYKPVIYNGQTYEALAGFLSVSEIQSNISNANDEIQIAISAIPANYIALTLDTQIKGGEVNIYRAFFDYTTQEVITNAVYRRFTGIISNFSVQEDVDAGNRESTVSHTITLIASSIMGVLENKVSGRRTNRQDYQMVWPELNNSASDPSMDRVEVLFNSSFDFGKDYVARAASSAKGAGGGSGGNNTDYENAREQP